MAYQVRQLNKKTGVTYVYEAVSVWDKELKQPRNKQVCIGKIDPVTDEFVPSKRLSPTQTVVHDLAVTASAQVVGPTLVLDAISERIGLRSIMKSVFPESYQEFMAMAYYLASQGGALSLCSAWAKSHIFDCQRTLSTMCWHSTNSC